MTRAGNQGRAGGALFLYKSANKKLSPVVKVPYTGPAKDAFPFRPEPRAPFCCSTYVSIAATCPDSCRFKRAADGTASGCYVDAGKTVFTIRRLDKESKADPTHVVESEAKLIDAAWPGGIPQDGARGGRDLRLHVGGDVDDAHGALMLAGAAGRWWKRGGGSVWTFTHRWTEMRRSCWGRVSVLASVEDEEQIRHAHQLGYAFALVEPREHRSAKAYSIGNGFTAIPCPAETRGKTCVECRLCLDADKLRERKMGIAFSLHGAGINKALVRLGYGKGGQRKLL